MAPYTTDTTSSDEDAPESFSLVQSKRTVQEQDNQLKKFQTAAKQKKKKENRERDRKLKERAMDGKKKGKEVAKGDGDAVVRMERAMREAAEEMDADDNESNGEGESKAEGFDQGEDEDEDSSENEENGGGEDREMDGDEDMESSDDESSQGDIPATNRVKLPDHLFSSTFISKSSQSSSLKRSSPAPKPQKKRSKGRKRSPKDLIIGSRAVRTLSKSSLPVPSRTSLTIPTAKVRKFVDRSLGLKGGGNVKAKSKAKGWERRAANIGVMSRTNGPAAGFVRNR